MRNVQIALPLSAALFTAFVFCEAAWSVAGEQECTHLLISNQLTLPNEKPEISFNTGIAEANRLMKGLQHHHGKYLLEFFKVEMPTPTLIGDLLGAHSLGVDVTFSPASFGGSIDLYLYYPDRWEIVSAGEREAAVSMGLRSLGRYNPRVHDHNVAIAFFQMLDIPKILQAALIQTDSSKALSDFNFVVSAPVDLNAKIEAVYRIEGSFSDRELDYFLSYLGFALYNRNHN